MKRADRLEQEIRGDLDEFQPLMVLRAAPGGWKIVGTFDVKGHAGEALDQFEVEILVPHRFPDEQPVVREVGGRIPATPDRHVNPGSNTLCFAVWPEWLAKHADHAFSTFLNVTLNAYFLGQLFVEAGKPWPQGERAHGKDGEVEAARAMLGPGVSDKKLVPFLKALRGPWPKGHWECPCGSGHSIRHCCRDRLWKLAKRVSPMPARQHHDLLCKPKERLGLRRRSQWEPVS